MKAQIEMTSSPVVSDWIEKAIAMVYHRECTSTESGVASQASWKNKIPTSSTVKHHKTKTAFLKLISKAILQKKSYFVLEMRKSSGLRSM